MLYYSKMKMKYIMNCILNSLCRSTPRPNSDAFIKKMTTMIEMRVHMDCGGCESKVKSSLQKLKGVDNVETDMALQKVTVTGWADQKKILKTVRRTGRRAELWQLPYNPEHFANSTYYYDQNQVNGPLPPPGNHFAPAPSSSYNYRKHGYDTHDPRYYHQPVHSSIFPHQTGSAFSDENPHACSIM